MKVVKEHQTLMNRNDKENRCKRLLLGDVPEEDVSINDTVCETDNEKVEEVFNIMNVNEIVPSNIKRIGKKDQRRPRYILLDFTNKNERNRVKKESEKLKEDNQFFIKADRPKREREEYKRLYKIKEELEMDRPGRPVEIKYGKLYVENILVDQIEPENRFSLL